MLQVLKIERIQHAKLWRRFALRRTELLESRGRNGEARLAAVCWAVFAVLALVRPADCCASKYSRLLACSTGGL